MTELLPSSRLWLCEAQKNKSWQKKPTPKETLTYSMRYMAQILLDATTDIASHKNSSVEWKFQN